MSLEFQIAQLRHAYSHLVAERVSHQKEFANGLISPIIRALEEMKKEMDDESDRFRRERLPQSQVSVQSAGYDS